jgi:hypothetical protein
VAVTDAERPTSSWVLVGTGLLADLIGIAVFLGFEPDETIRLVLGGVIAAVGIVASAWMLVRALLYWASPAGSYEVEGYHRTTIGTRLAALAATLALGGVVVYVALNAG